MTVVPAAEAHWAALKAVRLAALLDAPAAFGVTYEKSSANTDEDWRAHAAGRRGVAFFLAYAGAQPVGLAGGVTDVDGQYHLIAMWVHPDYRGSGAAALLAAAVKAHAAAAGHARVVLEVAPENTSAVRFYQRQGFHFLPRWTPLASHPAIRLQAMEWLAPRP